MRAAIVLSCTLSCAALALACQAGASHAQPEGAGSAVPAQAEPGKGVGRVGSLSPDEQRRAARGRARAAAAEKAAREQAEAKAAREVMAKEAAAKQAGVKDVARKDMAAKGAMAGETAPAPRETATNAAAVEARDASRDVAAAPALQAHRSVAVAGPAGAETPGKPSREAAPRRHAKLHGRHRTRFADDRDPGIDDRAPYPRGAYARMAEDSRPAPWMFRPWGNFAYAPPPYPYYPVRPFAFR